MVQEKKEELALIQLLQENPKLNFVISNPDLLELLSLLSKNALAFEELRFKLPNKNLKEVIAIFDNLEQSGLISKTTIKGKKLYYASNLAKNLLEKTRLLKGKLKI